MAQIVSEIIDGDGHIYEWDDEIQPYLDPTYCHPNLRNFYFFPTLDGWHRGALRARSGGMHPHPYAEDWVKFMNDLDISQAVIYPTAGLGFAFIKDPLWAVELAKGYNNYLYHRFLK